MTRSETVLPFSTQAVEIFDSWPLVVHNRTSGSVIFSRHKDACYITALDGAKYTYALGNKTMVVEIPEDWPDELPLNFRM